MFLAGKPWKLICYYISVLEVFWIVILSNNLYSRIKHEYRDILNLITYKLNISNLFSLLHAFFSLQVERWMCHKCELYKIAILLINSKKSDIWRYKN